MARKALFLAAASLIVGVSSALASEPGALLKPTEGLTARDEVRVQVILSEMGQIKGYGFDVNYDPTQYEFVRAEQGMDNLLGGASPLFLTSAKEPGKVMIGYATPTSGGGVSSSGPAAVLTFRKIGNALGEFRLSNLLVLDASGGVNSIKNVQALDLKPKEFGLDQNYPNPFNPATQIAYRLPVDSNVRLAVYNILGQQIRTLMNGFTPAGAYTVTWDGKDEAGRQVASGMYLYRLDAGKFSSVKRMTLLK
ncbi:MAG: T9SS type A sorting domain-containing protein [Deltaproteobacteria bacterium]|nr:T9SS type A sorting domain-containing protein [Deltaproteobacteria bacterium]